MTLFRYKALTSEGGLVAGVLEAPSELAVIAQIRQSGQLPISTSLAQEKWFSKVLPHFDTRRFSSRRLAIASQELTVLLEAGVDLERALGILQRLGDLGSLRDPISAVHLRVREGSTFGDALAAEGFPELFVSGIRAGESSGRLEGSLRRLSDYITRSVAIEDAVASALIYPVVLAVVASFSILVILVFVLPEFKPLFEEAGKSLPWPARTLMALGDFFRAYWWVLLLLTLSGGVATGRSLRTPAPRMKLDRFLLGLPLLGRLLAAIELERFSRTLGTLLANGLDLATAVPVANRVIHNRVLAGAVSESAVGIREGAEFADKLMATGVFPPVMLDLIRIGEESGRLDEMLLKQADLDEQHTRHTIDRLLALLVPGLTILLGLLVGGLIASLITAILSLNELALPR